MNTTNDDGKKGTEVPRGMHSVVPGLNNLDCACEDPREVTDLVLENAVTLALSFSIHVQQVLEWKENLDREIVGDMTEVATYYRAVARVALSGDARKVHDIFGNDTRWEDTHPYYQAHLEFFVNTIKSMVKITRHLQPDWEARLTKLEALCDEDTKKVSTVPEDG